MNSYRCRWSLSTFLNFLSSFSHHQVYDNCTPYHLPVKDKFPDFFDSSAYSSFFVSVVRLLHIFALDGKIFLNVVRINRKILRTIIYKDERFCILTGRLFKVDHLILVPFQSIRVFHLIWARVQYNAGRGVVQDNANYKDVISEIAVGLMCCYLNSILCCSRTGNFPEL